MISAQESCHLTPQLPCDLSPQRVLIYSCESLCNRGGTRTFPSNYSFIGAAVGLPRPVIPFPWNKLRSDLPKLFFSLGTVNADKGHRLYKELVGALREEPIQVIVVAPDQSFLNPPDHFIVQSRVPQLELLKHVDAVFCHAGHNTTIEALSEGLPLIMTPIKDDQPIVAQQVVEAGAGIRLPFGRVKANKIKKAVQRILNEPAFRLAAKQIQSDLANTGGLAHATKLVEAEIHNRA